jgi:tetratricopeptide (TPR) repeat protein
VTTDAAVGGGTGRADDEQERWSLNDQREFLLRSIDDAEREHEAGDLATADYDVLLHRDRARLAEVEAELAALGPAAPEAATPEPPVAPPRSRRATWRLVGMAVACLFIVVGAVILVNHAVNPALPGQPVSGSTTLSKENQIEEQLQEAAILNNQGRAVAALQLYDKVLAEDPADPVALAASGWLEWNYGNAGRSAALMRAGRQAEQKSIRLAPTYYAGHLFLGLIVLNQDHNAPAAIKEFTLFLAEHPPQAELTRVSRQVASAYILAKVPYPAVLAAAIPTTTTTTSAP